MIEIVNRETGELLDTDSVPGLAEVAALHHQQLERIGELVEELLDGQEDAGSSRQGPVVWDRLSPMQAKQTWRALADWVSWLRERYPVAQKVPTCWWRHSEIVEEVTALWLAWREAYVEKGAPLSGGADWHGRWLPEFLRRIGAGGWNLACEGEHRPIVENLYEARAVDDQRQFEQFIKGSAPGPAATEGARRMDDDTMADTVATGEGIHLGDFPDSPVKFDDTYWIRDQDGWVQVDSPDTIAFLRDAERRMRLADEAVRGSERS